MKSYIGWRRKGKSENRRWARWCILALWFLLLSVLSLRVSAAPKKEQELVITFHYERYDGDYEGYHIWSWTDKEEGSEYDFSGEDEYGAWTQVHYSWQEELPQIGFLVKINDWEAGEVAADRFVDLSSVENGSLDVYILQNDTDVYYAKEDLPSGIRFLKTSLDSFTEVSFEIYLREGTGSQGIPEFSVIDEEGSVYEIADCQVSAEEKLISGSLIIEEVPDLHRNLYLICNGEKGIIHAGGVFDTPDFQERFCYAGADLGAVWNKEYTSFRLWAPTATKAEVVLYERGTGGEAFEICPMEESEGGTWYLKKDGDLDGVYYTYRVTVEGETREVTDPYARTCGLNGERGMILNAENTDPDSFYDENVQNAGISQMPILYEMSVRDFSMDRSASFSQRGTYAAAAQTGVTNTAQDAAGIDYLEELGITYVHLLPTQDSMEVDEEDVAGSYNWGYMTYNFFTPEGAYSTDPENGAVRVSEFKQMVSAFHRKGIGVVMDVVYNHTTWESGLESIVPGYYYRKNGDGSFSNGSGCGNEVASERGMARKLIVDSVCYWLEEYHVDGFRFDLMGLIDLDTMNEIQERASAIRSDVLLYGEGWTGGTSSYEGETGMSSNAQKMPGIGVFSNVYRRGIQKYVCGIFEEEQADGSMNSIVPAIRFGIVAATDNEATKSLGYWTLTPFQCINYASCHDGYTLWDLIRLSTPDETEEQQKRRKRLEAAVTLTAQGIPFFQSGEEFLRSKTKDGDISTANSNSYNAGDEINSLKWELVTQNSDMVEYYKGLIAFRKAHPGLRLETTQAVQEQLAFLDVVEEPAVGYIVREKLSWWREDRICVLHNPTEEEIAARLPLGIWKVYVDAEHAGTDVLSVIAGGTDVTVEGISALVLVSFGLSGAGWGAAAGAVIVLGGCFFLCRRRGGKKQ